MANIQAPADHPLTTTGSAIFVQRVETALSEYDNAIKPCPVNNPRAGRVYAPNDKCESCGARADQNCGLEATASYHLVAALRRIVASGEGASHV